MKSETTHERLARKGRTLGVAGEVVAERQRQHEKWGEQTHPDGTGGALAANDEIDAKRACQQAAAEGRCTWRLILDEEVREAFAESDPDRLRAELVQVAAVAASWIEAIDRRSGS